MALVGLISACQSNISGPQLAADLLGKWHINAINQQATLNYSTAYLAFSADGVLSGNNSCNQFGGHYQLQGNQLNLNAEQGTLKACVDALMQQEQQFSQVLPRITQLHMQDDKLTLLDAKRHPILQLTRIQ
ncbi:META domain-containing protein [Shewanella mangrovi]|nr:META domain-containing protein [Shewanella mangrovi]